ASARARAEQADPRVRATLELGLQLELERLVRDAAISAGRDVQIAALVVEIDGRAVRAATGSAGRDRAGGWLDLSDRPRSPGSVLKPLIYAQAFEDGLVTAATRIEDTPRSFGGYAPANFDRGYRGEVTIAQALQQSLNVPAVQLLAATGAPRYAATLAMAGARPALPAGGHDAASLALALGGFGISVADVASLYAALGDGGQMRPLAWTEQAADSNRTGPAQAMVAGHAARRVLAVLSDAPPPDGRLPARLLAGAPQPAFKTGTSWGFRDAWAAGVVGEHVIVVWVGRADGAPRPGVTGQGAALPLLFDLADVLARRHTSGLIAAVQPARDAVGARDALRRFGERDPAPDIIFPPDGAEVWAEDQERSFVPAARGRAPLRWYSNGAPVPLDAAGAPVWTPGTPGFHELVVVDREGRSASTRVRVRTF
ncbi:MAG: penicillin-binding protein 1C, partial [Gammaproteobacteria bacterium]|nr:penicillin-binding protein 1C [Gammaproteobacteria bacterium]